MVQYTYSALLGTFDFIKKTINFADIFIQLCYILYVVYRLTNQLGVFYINIALLVLTSSYLIYHLLMIREFYTKKQLIYKKTIRNIVKIAKYLIILYVIIISVLQLYKSTTIDNMAMLMTMLMIIGFILSIIFDFIRIVINNQIDLIKYSFLYDAELVKTKFQEFQNTPLGKPTGAILRPLAKKFKLDKIPVLDNDKMRKKIILVNHKQENKKRRKENFIIKSK